MSQRRGRGEGSIQRNEDGSGWLAVYELPREPGGRRRRKKRRARTRAEAQRLLRGMRAEFESNGRLADRQRTVAETMADYLEGRRSAGLAKSSLDRDERFCGMISEYFEKMKTASLSVADCDRFLYEVSVGLPDQSGAASRQRAGRDHLRRLRSTLRAGLHNDRRLGLLTTNPAELAALPSDTGSYTELRALTLEELSRLLAVAAGPAKILIDLIGRHGLRPAEARAATWGCVDLVGGTLRVQAQLSSTNQITRPKTARAARSIQLHPEAVSLLMEEATDATEGDFLASTSSGQAIDRNNFARSLRRLCGAALIDPAISPYELRHTAITHQCERGYHAWQVADWAGTSEKMIYLHYRHVLDEVIELPPLDLT